MLLIGDDLLITLISSDALTLSCRRLVTGYAFDGDKLYLLHTARIGMLNVMLLRYDDVNEDFKF